MHPRNTRELSFKMCDRAHVRIIGVEITERSPQKRVELRFVMIALGADFDQLDEVSRGLSAQIIAANSDERIFDDDLGQRVQSRFSAWDERNLRFEKQIELTRERRLCAASAFGDGLDTTERFGAPGDNETGVAELSFANQDRARAVHGSNLARQRVDGVFSGRSARPVD